MNPTFILSRKKVLEQYNKVSGLADMVSYSSKTNPLITSILEESTKCLFSIHLINELKNVQDKSRVLFLAQGWKADDIKFLLNQGVKNFAVDNEVDLDILLESLEDNKINLFLRLKLKENTLRTERYFVFGMNSEIISKRVKELSNDKNIEKLGVHFHRKTQNMSEWNYRYELENIFDEEVFSKIDFINMGGGLPAGYANTNVKVLASIFSKINRFKEWLNGKGIKLVLEPGRFIAAPAVKLVTEVISIYDGNIVVNASVYNSDLDALIVPVKLLVEGEGQGLPYVVKGITPCSMDLFRYRVYLPEVKVGDKLTFLNAGAYNFTTKFCDLEEIKTEIVE